MVCCMNIIFENPPMFDEIDKVFNVKGKPILFAWGTTGVFNPLRCPVPHELEHHELAHMARQGDTPESWWRRYLDDAEFRLAEEVVGHQAEYRAFCERNKDRNHRAFALHRISARLASALYGNLIKTSEARKLIA